MMAISRYARSRALVLVFVSLLAAVGTGLIILSKAASSQVAIEAENGVRSTGVAQIASSSASGGSAIRFSATPANSGATGTWASGADDDWDGSFGTWRGTPSTINGCWADGDVENQTNAWCIREGGSWTYDVDFSPGLFVDGETMAQAASGVFDSRWRSALRIVNDNWGSKRVVYIRPAHELNGDWYPWSVTSANAAQFRQAWIRYYNIFQEELVQKGRNAKLELGFNWSTQYASATIDEIWPGDQYVDVVGVDFYDVFWTGANTTDHFNTQAKWDTMQSWNDHHGRMGLNAWSDFARSHNKPMSFPEWGLSDHGGYDDPFFIQQFHDWVAAHAGSGPGQVVHEIYFEVRAGYPGMWLEPPADSPNAAARYRSLTWGHQ